MIKSWEALRLYYHGTKFLRIQGEVSLQVSRLEPALLNRTAAAIKRGFGTASQGPTHRLLEILAKENGYNPHGFPYSSWSGVVLYVPAAARDDYTGVCDSIEALLNLDGTARQRGHRHEERLSFALHGNYIAEPRKRLRKFLKEQSAKWMIFRQPMLDFLNDPTRSIVWDFDSDYREKQS